MTQLWEYLIIKRGKNSQVLNAQLHKTSFSYFLVTVTHMFDFIQMFVPGNLPDTALPWIFVSFGSQTRDLLNVWTTTLWRVTQEHNKGIIF